MLFQSHFLSVTLPFFFSPFNHFRGDRTLDTDCGFWQPLLSSSLASWGRELRPRRVPNYSGPWRQQHELLQDDRDPPALPLPPLHPLWSRTLPGERRAPASGKCWGTPGPQALAGSPLVSYNQALRAVPSFLLFDLKFTWKTNDPCKKATGICITKEFEKIKRCLSSVTSWRNGSASDSRSDVCVFKSRRGHGRLFFHSNALEGYASCFLCGHPGIPVLKYSREEEWGLEKMGLSWWFRKR